MSPLVESITVECSSLAIGVTMRHRARMRAFASRAQPVPAVREGQRRLFRNLMKTR